MTDATGAALEMGRKLRSPKQKLRLTYKFVGLEEIGDYDDVLNVCCVWEIQGLLLFFANTLQFGLSGSFLFACSFAPIFPTFPLMPRP